MRTPVEIGIVGTGPRLVRLVRAFEEVSRASLRWVCDPTAETRLGPIPHRRERVRTTLRLDDLLLDEALDAIVVATPVPTHYELAWAALSADKHVLIDAPATSTSDQSDTLAELAAARARRLSVVQPLLFHPGMQKLKELVDLGRLGELYYLRLDWCAGAGESSIWTLCAEPLALLPYLLDDEPVEVAGRAESYAEADVVELLVCHFRFATGITVQLHASVLEPHACARLAVVGSRRMAIFDELETERKLTVYDKPSGVRGRAGRAGEIVCPQLRDGDPLVFALEHFVERIRERGATAAAPAPAVAAVHLIEALQESIVRGGAVVPLDGGAVAAAAAPVIPLPLHRE